MKTAVVFPGQGAQTRGMGKEFYDNFEAAREMFVSANNNSVNNRNYTELCFNGTEEELQSTINTQPAIYIVNCVIYRLLKEKNITPVITGGHSLGEYSALYAAGVFDFETGLQLIEKRAAYMDECAREKVGAMAAVMGVDDFILREFCKESGGIVNPAGYNSPGQIVISGEAEAVKSVIEKCKGMQGTKCIELKVSGGWHSELMRPAQNKLAEEFAKIKFNSPEFPVVSNFTASAEKDPAIIKDALIKQLCEPVRWLQSVEFMTKEFGIQKFVEAGPGKVLTGLIKRIDKSAALFNVNSIEALNGYVEN